MNKHLNVLITPQAKKDIIEIIHYISNDNAKVALKINDTFKNIFEMLSAFPLSGASKYSIQNQSVRIYSIKKQYSIVYRIKENQIEILRVLTRYQDILAIL